MNLFRHHLVRPIPLLVVLILFIVALRVFLMSSLPLTDSTEARYGELARVTAIGHYWLMPHMTPAQPFFAKPPLSTWFSAASWLSLGQNEFALRLPSLLLILLSCAAFFYGAASFNLSRQQCLFACLIVMASPIGFVSAGAVMTDATQLAIITWAMVFLWRTIGGIPVDTKTANRQKLDRLGFWMVLAVGSLAKGLVTWVLIGLPVAMFWLLIPKKEVIKQISTIMSWSCVLVFLTIVLAWYIPAEIYYPGFLKYFIVGEHFQRFLEPGWKGDMYGIAHSVPIGMIWVYWVASIAVWLPFFIDGLRKDRPLLNVKLSNEKKWLWAWVLAPLLFFTFSRNIIWTYTLTALPAFAILAVKLWPSTGEKFKQVMKVLVACWLVLVTIATLVWLPRMAETKSARMFVHKANTQYQGMPLYSYESYKFSSSYYTQSKIRMIENHKMLEDALLVPNNLIIMSMERAKTIEQGGQGVIVGVNANHALLMSKPNSK